MYQPTQEDLDAIAFARSLNPKTSASNGHAQYSSKSLAKCATHNCAFRTLENGIYCYMCAHNLTTSPAVINRPRLVTSGDPNADARHRQADDRRRGISKAVVI